MEKPVSYNSAGAIKDITTEIYGALRARFVELAVVVDVVSAERQALADEIARREKDAGIRIRLGALSPDDRELYRAVIDSPPT